MVMLPDGNTVLMTELHGYSLSNVDTFQIFTELTETRRYRAEVQDGNCPSVFSNEVIVSIVTKPVAGNTFDDKFICGGINEDTLFLRNHIGDIVTWQQDDGSGWMDIAGSTDDTLIVNNVLQTTEYRALVNNEFCPNDTSTTVTTTVISETFGGDLEEDTTIVCLEE